MLLGSDLLENPQFMARLNAEAPPAAPAADKSPATDKLVAAKTEAKRPAAGHQEPLGENQPKAGPGQQPLPPKSKEVEAQPLTSSGTAPDRRRTDGHGHRGQERHLDQKSGP